MSDASTDIKRDMDRDRCYTLFNEQLVTYLKDPSEDNLAELQLRAKNTDEIPRGYRDGQTSLLSIFTEDLLARLVAKDPEEWKALMGGDINADIGPELRALSPFPDV